MPGATEIAGDIAQAATAMAGLLLVYLGAVAVSFDSFGTEHQEAVREKFKRRAARALFGFFLALLAAELALISKWLQLEWVTLIAGLLMAGALVFAAIAGYMTVGDIE